MSRVCVMVMVMMMMMVVRSLVIMESEMRTPVHE